MVTETSSGSARVGGRTRAGFGKMGGGAANFSEHKKTACGGGTHQMPWFCAGEARIFAPWSGLSPLPFPARPFPAPFPARERVGVVAAAARRTRRKALDASAREGRGVRASRSYTLCKIRFQMLPAGIQRVGDRWPWSVAGFPRARKWL